MYFAYVFHKKYREDLTRLDYNVVIFTRMCYNTVSLIYLCVEGASGTVKETWRCLFFASHLVHRAYAEIPSFCAALRNMRFLKDNNLFARLE